MGNETMSVVKIFGNLPEALMQDVLAEIKSIDWNQLPFPDHRSRTSVFRTSTALHLRVHKVDGTTADTLQAHGEIIECVDTVARAMFPAIENVLSWVYREVVGVSLGRVMLVKLAPHGAIGAHIDRGAYFRHYKRFHLPLLTSPEVLFHGSSLEHDPTHVPAGVLCQLFNGRPHGVISRWEKDRLHLIFDIETLDTRFCD